MYYTMQDIEEIINNLIITSIDKECRKLFEENTIKREKSYEDIKIVYQEKLEGFYESKDKQGLVEVYKNIYVDSLNYLFKDSLEDMVPIMIERNITGTEEEIYIWGSKEFMELESEHENIEDDIF